MSTTLDSCLSFVPSSLDLDPRWRTLVEEHIQLLRTDENITVTAVDYALANKYNGDLIGYLGEVSSMKNDWWVIARMNKMTSSTEFGTDTTHLVYPSSRALAALKTIFNSKYGSL